MVDPGANINCVGCDWITRFESPEWNYALECGSVKAACGHTLDVEARVLLKISWPPEDPVLSVNQWFHIVHGEDGVVLGTPACRALGVIDDQWPLSTLAQKAKPSTATVKTLEADPVQPTPCIRVDAELLSETSNPKGILPPSDDDLLTNLKWMQDPVDKVQPQVTVIEAFLQLPIVQSSDEVDLSSLVRDYEEIFDETVLPAMSGESFKINLKPNATPYAQLKARKIPIPYMEQLQKQLHDMEQLGVISPYEEPSSWCHPIVIAPKKDTDELRICIDFTRLNKFIQREYHLSNSPFEAVTSIPQEELAYFCKFDARHGYWQVPLAAESRPLTCFITPFGRYVCNRAAFGINSISEWYNRRMDKVTAGLEGVRKIVDDILIYAPSPSILKKRACAFLDRCRQHGITLKRTKSQVAVTEVDFDGFHLSRTGIQTSPDLLKSIRDFPRPGNLTDLRSWFGLVNQLGNFSKELTAIMSPLRPLLSKNAVFQWLPEHDDAFVEAKSRLSSAPVLTYFAVDRKTILATDASRLKGLGFVLLQLVDDVWKPVQAGSRFLTPAESRYAMIELEALATCWAMKKCNMFVQGLPHFTLLTDHQPLIPILNSMGIADVENPRLQRLMMKMLPYSFTAEWVKGKDHLAADALSRFPVDQPSLDDELCDVHAEAAVKIQFADESVEDLQLQEVSEAQQNDPQLSQVTEYIRCGWPDSLQEVATIAKPFWPIRHNLYLITPTSGSSII